MVKGLIEAALNLRRVFLKIEREVNEAHAAKEQIELEARIDVKEMKNEETRKASGAWSGKLPPDANPKTLKRRSRNMQTMQLQSIPQAQNITMSSREIAELVNSRHDSVKRTIERLAESKVIIAPPMVDEQFTDAMGRERTKQRYIFKGENGKRDSIVVVAQLSPEFTGRIVDRWLELEKTIATKATTLTEYDKAIISNMVKNCTGLVIRQELEKS